MTSDLSIFAARLRDFISISMDESLLELQGRPEFRAHADIEFNGMALVLFALQFQHNAPYRKFCESRSILPNAVTHWTQIPAVPTAAFKEFEMTCLPPEERATVFHSSGTTEQKPSRHFHNAESLVLYEASLWPWFQRHVIYDLQFTIHDLIVLTPPPSQAPHSSLVHMCETVRQNLGAPRETYFGKTDSSGAWTLNFDALNSKLQTPNPKLILGTAFSFVYLLDFLAKKNLCFELPRGSRVMETGGYKGRSRSLPKSELHKQIIGRLGVPASHIICEYGMSELSSQAYDSVSSFEFEVSSSSSAKPTRYPKPGTRNFHFPPWARAQIISPETGNEVADGETGLIRVFDLANVFSVMAIQTEDLAIRLGDGFELIGRAEQSEPRGCSLQSV